MTPRHFDLICFDWDGTLFDSTVVIARAIQQAVVDVGGTRPSAQDAAFVIGLERPHVLPALTHVGQAWFGIAIAAAYAYLGIKSAN